MAAHSHQQSAIPLTIVTGFLGSGKTTLINYLLQRLIEEDKKVAIIQNEFGDSTDGVENAFMSGSDGELFTNVVELANGCICCSVRDNFALAVEQLAAQKKYDYILLECSGMADPGKIIAMFWIDPDLESDIYLDGVLSVVDGKYLTSYIKDDAEERLQDDQSLQVIHQIAYADKVIINKRDLIEKESDLQNVRTLIHSINSVGSILVTTKSEIKTLSDVLYLRAYDIVKPPNLEMLKEQMNPQTKEPQNGMVNTVQQMIHDLDDELHGNEQKGHGHSPHLDGDHDHNHQHGHGHGHGAHDVAEEQTVCAHDANIKSIMMESRGKCVDLDKLDEWLSELLWGDQYQETDGMEIADEQKDDEQHKMDIYRMKAVLPTVDGNNHYLSSVQDLFEVEKGNMRWKRQDDDGIDKCHCKMVVIGKYLDRDVLQKGFDSIYVEQIDIENKE